jgi:hypothetical protein
VAAYLDFFDHIAFRKGWREPPFKMSPMIMKCFILAAKVVVRYFINIDDNFE